MLSCHHFALQASRWASESIDTANDIDFWREQLHWPIWIILLINLIIISVACVYADFWLFILASLSELNDLRVRAHAYVSGVFPVSSYSLWGMLRWSAGPVDACLEFLGALRVKLSSSRRLIVLQFFICWWYDPFRRLRIFECTLSFCFFFCLWILLIFLLHER